MCIFLSDISLPTLDNNMKQIHNKLKVLGNHKISATKTPNKGQKSKYIKNMIQFMEESNNFNAKLLQRNSSIFV